MFIEESQIGVDPFPAKLQLKVIEDNFLKFVKRFCDFLPISMKVLVNANIMKMQIHNADFS